MYCRASYVYVICPLFPPLSLYFLTHVPLQITWIHPFPWIGFLPKHPIGSLAPMCPISLDRSTFQPEICFSIASMSVPPGQWVGDCHRTALGRAPTWCLFLWVCNLGSCLPLWYWTSRDGPLVCWWLFLMNMRVVGSGYVLILPPALVSLCSFVDICRSCLPNSHLWNFVVSIILVLF